MAKQGTLKEQAEAKGISVRALIIDAVDGADDYADAADKLGISRQGLLQAMDNYHVGARKISHLEVVVGEREPTS